MFKRGDGELLTILGLLISCILLLIGKEFALMDNIAYWIIVLFILLSFMILIYQKRRKKNILRTNGKVVYARTKECKIIHGRNVEWYEFTSYILSDNDNMVINEFKCLIRDFHCTYKSDMEKIVEKGVLPDMKIYVDPEDETKYFVDKTEYFKQVLDYNSQIMGD